MLICLAAVGAALVLMFLWFLAALVFRWRFQFGILSLLLLVVAVAVPCSWLATEMKKAKTQREAVAAITRLCKTVQYDYQCDTSGDNIPGAQPPGPQWFRNLLGEDFFASVVYVDLSPGTVIFVGLGRTEELRLLQEGHINDQSRVTDADLKHLNGLTELLRLNLNEAAITDAGLETLTGSDPTPGTNHPLHRNQRSRLGTFEGTEATSAVDTVLDADRRHRLGASNGTDATPVARSRLDAGQRQWFDATQGTYTTSVIGPRRLGRY